LELESAAVGRAAGLETSFSVVVMAPEAATGAASLGAGTGGAAAAALDQSDLTTTASWLSPARLTSPMLGLEGASITQLPSWP